MSFFVSWLNCELLMFIVNFEDLCIQGGGGTVPPGIETLAWFLFPVVSHEGSTGRCAQLGLMQVLCRSSIFSPPRFYLSDMWRELYTLSPEEQFLSTQCGFTQFCNTLVLTASSSSSTAMSSPLCIIPWEWVRWLLFRLSLYLFWVGPLVF